MDKSIKIIKKPDSAEVHVWKINIQVNLCCSRDICGLNLFGNSLSTFLLLKKFKSDRLEVDRLLHTEQYRVRGQIFPNLF